MNRKMNTMKRIIKTLQVIVADLGSKYDTLKTNWAMVSRNQTTYTLGANSSSRSQIVKKLPTIGGTTI